MLASARAADTATLTMSHSGHGASIAVLNVVRPGSGSSKSTTQFYFASAGNKVGFFTIKSWAGVEVHRPASRRAGLSLGHQEIRRLAK